ncbi:hypothetical protein HG535_0A03140 [Zygotorulaspora mrakii]|uniref:DNA polymerase alpha subunit B n=1 Tax=Zygotorulaspora mrakii TaxID=42260 RepID=A0A7H9AVQ2_ZYGMR|nr:uncharacterized protein HG535_0A03140 [Zygotorulaspora mrakii]QLG70375.1 hypothetical protein HG535_0A03140 [Zygotorulaspora mrakii]
MTIESEILSQFGPEANTPEIVSGLEHLVKLHALSIEDLYIKWEQFSYQRHDINSLSESALGQFKNFLQLQVEKRAARIPNISKPTSSTKKPKVLKPLGSSPLFGLNVQKTPTQPKRKLNPSPSNPDKKSRLEFTAHSLEKDSLISSVKDGESKSQNAYIKQCADALTSPRRNVEPGKILDSLNPENLEIGRGIDVKGEQHVKIIPLYEPQLYKFRTMRQNLLDASDVLDEQIESFTKIVQQHFQLSPSDFGDPTIQAQNEIYTVGRIVPDSPSSDDFLNTESLALEISRMVGIGRRVRLDLTYVSEGSFFSGQIVALRGTNATGDSFTVSELLHLPYPNSPVSTADELEAYKATLNGSDLKVILTSGPYFSDTSFDMDYLMDFVDRINTKVRPHVLIMFGPFIDVTHPMVAEGTIPHFTNLKTQPNTLDEVFIKVVAPVLKKIDQNIQVILIPSTRDAISKHAAYPQDSLDKKQLQLTKNFKLFTNPATFQLNEVFFGCSNVDAFKDLREITKGGNTSMRNRFDRVSELILQQRRFYPQFPGAIKKLEISPGKSDDKVFEHISGADLEIPYLGLTEMVGDFAPDVIVIPSELQHFTKVVQNVIMINPGKFIKPSGAPGTYAQITISSPNINDGKLTRMSDTEPVYLHNVWKRARIDIVSN